MTEPTVQAGQFLTVPPRLKRAFVAGVVAVALGLVASYALILWNGAVSPRQSDFITYFSTGKMVLAGNGHMIYSAAPLAAVERTVVHPYSLRYGLLPFVYPPYFALATVSAARFTLEQAYAVWLCCSAAILVLVVAATQRYAGLAGPARALYYLGVLSFVPAFASLVHGQTSLLLLGLMTLAFFGLRSGRDPLVGVVLALALIKPPYLVPILVMLVVRRRWRALAWFGASASLLAGLPIVVLGPTIDLSYLDALRAAAGWTDQYGYQPQLSVSFSGVAGSLLPHGPAVVFTLCLDVLALAYAVRLFRGATSTDLCFAAAVLCGILISPHVLVHDLVLALLPLSIALRERHRAPVSADTLAGACYVMAVAGFLASSYVHIPLATLSLSLLAWWLHAISGPVRPKASFQPGRKVVYGS